MTPGRIRKGILIGRNRSALFDRRQTRFAHRRINEVGDQGPEAYICEEMAGHVDAVVAVNQNINTGGEEAEQILSRASLFRHIRKHREREHHTGNGHVAAGPGFEAVVATGEIRDHLPPAAELTHRVFQRDQVLMILGPIQHRMKKETGTESCSFL